MISAATGGSVIHRILIDVKGVQACQHYLAGNKFPSRLTSFLASLQAIENTEVAFSANIWRFLPKLPRVLQLSLVTIVYFFPFLGRFIQTPISSDDLDGSDLLIITTRSRLFPYHDSELTAIERFVHDGGALLLMANHSSVPGMMAADFTTQDSRLAELFGVGLVRACFHCPDELSKIEIRNEQFSIGSILVNNCCAISKQSKGMPIAVLNHAMKDMGSEGLIPDDKLFAVAIDNESDGRVVVVADSGFICEPNVAAIGPGLYDRADNSTFAKSVVLWLLRQV